MFCRELIVDAVGVYDIADFLGLQLKACSFFCLTNKVLLTPSLLQLCG